MADVLVRGLPDDVHAALKDRAKANGLSLNEWLTRLLTGVVLQNGGTFEYTETITKRLTT